MTDNQQLDTYLAQVLPDQACRQHVLDILKPNYKTMVWVGSGSNGKSTLYQLLESTLREYLEGKKIKLRLIEGSGNWSYVKQLRFSDDCPESGLYGSSRPYKYINIIHCNHIPQPVKDDKQFGHSLNIIHFTSEFVDHPTSGQFKRFVDMDSKFPEWKQAFMALLTRE